jgi:hypothetical protein
MIHIKVEKAKEEEKMSLFYPKDKKIANKSQ